MSTAEEHERPGTVLRGRALSAARAAWVALVATVLALFVTGIPASYRTARVLRPETVAGLEHLGVPTGLPAASQAKRSPGARGAGAGRPGAGRSLGS